MDTAGILTRTVADIVHSFAIIDPLVDEPAEGFAERLSQKDASDIRVGVCDWFFEDCEPGIAEAVKQAIDECSTRYAIDEILSFEAPVPAQKG